MDPQATLNDLLAAVRDRDWPRVEELSNALYDWLQKDGFAPPRVEWDTLPTGWQRHVATLICHLAKTEARMASVRRRRRKGSG